MELKTRIVLRNDSYANWLENETEVLLKGEVGIEFLADGKVKMKVGDGTKSWAELDYFGGETLNGDNLSVVVADGIIKINGFDEAVAGSQLVKGADGTLSWVLPDSSTVEGLATTMEILNTDVSNLQAIVGSEANGEEPATGLYALINEKANASDVYTKDEVKSLVSGLYRYRGTVSTYAELPAEGQMVGDVWNIETADAEHGIKAGDNVAWNGKSWDKLAGTVDLSGYVTAEQFLPVQSAVEEIPLYYLTKKQAKATLKKVKYEISNKPANTIVDYREKEIRVMCPADTAWKSQNVGTNGDSTKYYIGVKAYAPNDNIVSFKEDLAQTISDETMYYFENNEFAGIDEYDRKYSIVWLPVASYDATAGTWEYYGAKSSKQKYVGWYYSVEWYDANGNKVASDTIRINLSNEDCHNNIEPFYMSKVVKNVAINGTLLDIVNGQVDIPVAGEDTFGVVKSSSGENKVTIDENGEMEVRSVNINTLVQTDGDELILVGGSSKINK